MNQNMTTLDIYLEPADTARLANLCGPFDDNLKQLERRLGVEITYHNNHFFITGNPVNSHCTMDILRDLYVETQPVKGQVADIEPEQVHLAVQACELLEQESSPKVSSFNTVIKTKRYLSTCNESTGYTRCC